MSLRGPVHGAQLPYRLIAGVVPCSRGWLVATAKVQGVTIAPEEPQVLGTFIDVLDYKPAYQVIAVASAIGLLEEPVAGGRTCDREARKLLGPRRGSAVASAPIRPALAANSKADARSVSAGHLSAVTWARLPRIAEIDRAIAPYWQRTVYEVHPELSFFQLNDDRPCRAPKRTLTGQAERAALLTRRLPGVERIIDAVLPGVSRHQLIDAAACLWTARRVLSRGISRIPEVPEWDPLGLRMEIVR